MINHSDMQTKLAAYAGGDLDQVQRLQVEAHLAGCASCRAELADLRTALRLIRTTPEAEPPPWLATRIMARIREEEGLKRGWLQRFFFPLQVKLPLEVAALLVVCVTGYYLARTVETDLQQPVAREELPAAAPETAKPAAVPGGGAPGAPPSPSMPSPAAQEAPAPEKLPPARPVAPKGASPFAPPPATGEGGRPAVQPPPAPSSPAMKVERMAPAAEVPYDSVRPFDAPPRSEKKAQRAAKMLAPEQGAESQDRAASGSAAPSAELAVRQVRLRLERIDTAAAPGAFREAVVRSGGSIVDDRSLRTTLRARIPSARLDELLERLGRLATVVERPSPRGMPGVVDIEIVW